MVEDHIVYPIGTSTGAEKERHDRLLAASFREIKPPDLTSVTSSNIAAVGHDNTALWVRFKNGSLYRYPSAGREHYDGLVGAKSPGSYHADRLRHFYRGERVG